MLQVLSTNIFDRHTRSTACVYFWWVIKNYLNQNKGIIRIRAWPIKSVSHWVVPETGGYGLWDWLNKTFLRRSRVSTRGIKLIYRRRSTLIMNWLTRPLQKKDETVLLKTGRKDWCRYRLLDSAWHSCLYNTSLIQFICLRKIQTQIFRKIHKNCCALNIKNFLDKTSKT